MLKQLIVVIVLLLVCPLIFLKLYEIEPLNANSNGQLFALGLNFIFVVIIGYVMESLFFEDKYKIEIFSRKKRLRAEGIQIQELEDGSFKVDYAGGKVQQISYRQDESTQEVSVQVYQGEQLLCAATSKENQIQLTDGDQHVIGKVELTINRKLIQTMPMMRMSKKIAIDASCEMNNSALIEGASLLLATFSLNLGLKQPPLAMVEEVFMAAKELSNRNINTWWLSGYKKYDKRKFNKAICLNIDLLNQSASLGGFYCLNGYFELENR